MAKPNRSNQISTKSSRVHTPRSRLQYQPVSSVASTSQNTKLEGRSMTPHPDERRASPRCTVVKNQLSIDFAAPEGPRRIGATLVNISRGGALVVADNPMSRAALVSLRIESPVRTDWVGADVVRFDPNRDIGLHFPQGCPDDLLLASTVGIDLALMVREGGNLTTVSD
jgi:hypothetical protein